MSKTFNKTRRKFLRNASSAILLMPFLRYIENVALAQAGGKRALFVFFPHGTPQAGNFFPGDGALNQVGRILEHSSEFRNQFLVLGGLSNGQEGYGHAAANTAVLTGAGKKHAPKEASMDWKIARSLNQEPLVVGLSATGKDRGIISFKSPSEAGRVLPVNNRTEAFKRVFARDPMAGTCEYELSTPVEAAPETTTSAPSLLVERSVLDAVSKDLENFKKHLPSWSRETFEEQMQAIRQLEQEAVANQALRLAGENGAEGASEACFATDDGGFHEKGQFMVDLIVSSFQSNRKQVSVLELGGASGDGLSVPGFGGYHGIIHNLNGPGNGNADRVVDMQKELLRSFAYLMKRLNETKDAAGNALIDSTVVYLCSEHCIHSDSADPHHHNNLPLMLAGASSYFDTTGKAKNVGARGIHNGGVLAHIGNYMGLNIQSLNGSSLAPEVRS